MAILNGGVQTRMEDNDKTSKLICVACGTENEFPIFTSFDSIVVFALPVGKFNKSAIAVCPKCASVYSVRERDVRFIEEKMTHLIDMNSLELIKNLSTLTTKETL